MRRVPEWLPQVLAWHDYRNSYVSIGAMSPGTHIIPAAIKYPTRMDLVVYESPAIVNNLLMTEIISGGTWGNSEKIERSFFGYRCAGCREIFLLDKNVRCLADVDRNLYHDCDPSDIRRAVRNARDLGRERGEQIIVGYNGRWWAEKINDVK